MNTRTKTPRSTKSRATSDSHVDKDENDAVDQHKSVDDQETEDDEEVETTETETRKKSNKKEIKRPRVEKSQSDEGDGIHEERKEKSSEKTVSPSKESREMKVHVSRFVEYEPQKIVALVRAILLQDLLIYKYRIGVSVVWI